MNYSGKWIWISGASSGIGNSIATFLQDRGYKVFGTSRNPKNVENFSFVIIALDVLKVELQKVENEVLQIAIKEQLKLAFVTSDEDLKYVQEEFTNFCKNQQLKRALMSSVDLLKAGDFDGIRFIVDNALKAGQDKNLGHEYVKDIEERYRENSRSTIPTPWDRMNKLLQGGLGNGDFGLIFGGPGGGKSWALVALGAFAANLGYGVSTIREPQTGTTDILSYGDMVDAGLMYGPRIYSTGPGVGYWAYNIKSLDQAKSVLKQYSKYYNTKTIKMYRTGNRKHRQWIIMAAKEQKLMPTTEGALNIKLNSISYLTKEEVFKLKKIHSIASYLETRQSDIEDYNTNHNINKELLLNGKNLTNIGVFRKYIETYIENHSGTNKEMMIMVRQLAPGTQGIPLEIYAFSNDKRWKNYEYIMADIFDHIIAAVPYFSLEIFEFPSNSSFMNTN